MHKLLVAPFDMHARLLGLIEREAQHARSGLPARIAARMNSLVDERTIEALYAASQAGVKIDLLVRGICCLRPGVKDLSANITVHSVVDRFLEHSRVWCFENACHPEAYISSADWMPRNFFRRIEVGFLVEDGRIADRLISEVMAISLADNVKAHELQSDGGYRRLIPKKGEPAHRSQMEFIALATGAHREDLPSPAGEPNYSQVRVATRPEQVAETGTPLDRTPLEEPTSDSRTPTQSPVI